jgi:nuclear pore complex protein Nup107
LFDYISQASISLSEAGDSLEHCDKLIELVASFESGMMHLFSQQQLQVTFILVGLFIL